MIIKPGPLSGTKIIQPELKKDFRGYFARIFCSEELKAEGIDFTIRQINQSLTKKHGTIRGLHYQKKPYEEAKLIRCLRGRVFDVGVDIRPESPSYGKWFSIELSEENQTILFLPKGFAHGFQTLTGDCEMEYLMSEYYYPEYNTGIRWDDKNIAVKWPIANAYVAEKDQIFPNFRDV